MTEKEVLQRLDLLDWQTLSLGIERGWLSWEDVGEFALTEFDADRLPEEAIDLLTPSSLEEQEGRRLLNGLAASESGAMGFALQAWILAKISVIAESEATEEEMLDKLEEAYAELGYPEEMAVCSKYYVPPGDREAAIGDKTASPLRAMDELLTRLRVLTEAKENEVQS